MSTRDDASLTAKERAALASLEAVAAAEDPQLASRLRGSRGLRLFTRMPAMPAWVRSTWWGIPALVVGLALVILSISVSLVLGVAGAVLAVAGLWLVIGMVDRRWLKRGKPN
jgi:Protein of unknown function (DUF3040)